MKQKPGPGYREPTLFSSYHLEAEASDYQETHDANSIIAIEVPNNIIIIQATIIIISDKDIVWLSNLLVVLMVAKTHPAKGKMNIVEYQGQVDENIAGQQGAWIIICFLTGNWS